MFKKNRYRSFSRRLTRRIVLGLMLTLIAVTASILCVATRVMNDYTSNYFQALMDVENETVEKVLLGVEVAVANSIDDIEEQLQSPVTVFTALRDELECNPQILGFFVSFEPDYYASQGKWFEPYAIWRDGRIDTMQIGSAKNDYLSDDWYDRAFAADSGYWSEPYFDEAGAKTIVCSYSEPIHDSTGRKVGVFGADISLDWLHEQLQQLDRKTNVEGLINVREEYKGDKMVWSYCFIVDHEGTYIGHPDKKRILKENFYQALRQQTDTAAHRLAREMNEGKRGFIKTEIDSLTSYVFYAPLEHTGWSMAIIVPWFTMYLKGIAFCILIALFIIIALLGVYITCRITIRRSTRPLHSLAKSADEVAKGNFNTPLPDIKHNDEIRMLRDSFGNMQQSLSQYIDDLKATTAEKSAIESELAIARNIQMAMLPKAETQAEDHEAQHFDIHAFLTPAKAVGGDLYDYFVRDNRLYFCIGDVSGKGAPAALVMAMVCGAFRLLAESESEPERIVSRMNNTMARDNDMCIFITFFVGVLDLTTGLLRYSNAGHKAPYVLNGASTIVLPIDRNLPVGVMADFEFTAQETTLAPGSTLFLYTDGLDEAEDAQQQIFGKARIGEALQHASTNPQALVEHMTQAVSGFVGDNEQSDDLTMLALQFK